MTKKNYNNPEYRADRRVVAFVNPALKKAILKKAKLEKRSISSTIGIDLGKLYGIE